MSDVSERIERLLLGEREAAERRVALLVAEHKRVESELAARVDAACAARNAAIKRAEDAEAALAKMTGERDRCCDDYQREAARAEAAEAEVVRLQRETVEQRIRIDLAEAEVARLKALLEAKQPYTPRVGDVVAPMNPGPYVGAEWLVTRNRNDGVVFNFLWLKASDSGLKYDGTDCTRSSVHYLRPATPAERAAAGLPVAPAKPELLPEHLAWIEADAAWADSSKHHDAAIAAAKALLAAVARRDGGGK